MFIIRRDSNILKKLSISFSYLKWNILLFDLLSLS